MSGHSSEIEYSDDNPWRSEDTLRELYHSERLSLPEIAEKFEISHQAVLYWFKKHGIERRSLDDYRDSRFANDSQPPARKTQRQALFCSHCGQSFSVTLSDVGSRKYCSRECAREGYSKSDYKKEHKTCENCDGVFKALPQRKYCCHKCYSEDIYDGGRPLAELWRAREKQAGWREGVFERDDYTCQMCGERGDELNAHHVVPVSDIMEDVAGRGEIDDHELFNDLSNGTTVCVSCHQQIHSPG